MGKCNNGFALPDQQPDGIWFTAWVLKIFLKFFHKKAKIDVTAREIAEMPSKETG
ncbi:hypothetical protein [Shewanella sedimentimangrovi]|uniref:Uncharacterized protein n=1 Tax=Shewanella sedimentimangrovi TaxID=2814293 RepID=A0ABX7QXC1_9GAMM|nr:hypothetical protein [Shewanella sedimentimangrovi]QSX36164.1 hypothetical protein JYB85_12560 [Shewanella sedimentimangrovi]